MPVYIKLRMTYSNEKFNVVRLLNKVILSVVYLVYCHFFICGFKKFTQQDID